MSDGANDSTGTYFWIEYGPKENPVEKLTQNGAEVGVYTVDTTSNKISFGTPVYDGSVSLDNYTSAGNTAEDYANLFIGDTVAKADSGIGGATLDYSVNDTGITLSEPGTSIAFTELSMDGSGISGIYSATGSTSTSNAWVVLMSDGIVTNTAPSITITTTEGITYINLIDENGTTIVSHNLDTKTNYSVESLEIGENGTGGAYTDASGVNWIQEYDGDTNTTVTTNDTSNYQRNEVNDDVTSTTGENYVVNVLVGSYEQVVGLMQIGNEIYDVSFTFGMDDYNNLIVKDTSWIATNIYVAPVLIPTNTAPVAVNNLFEDIKLDTLETKTLDILSKYSDAEGDTLSIANISATNGVAIINLT
jgi:hypothetical protein